jgi:hypothetical protein
VSEIVIPIFIKTWVKSKVTIATDASLPRSSVADAAISSPVNKSAPNAETSAIVPTNPSCSPIAAKMKSLWTMVAGKNPS